GLHDRISLRLWRNRIVPPARPRRQRGQGHFAAGRLRAAIRPQFKDHILQAPKYLSSRLGEKVMAPRIGIIGGGFTGLTAAYRLQKAVVLVTFIEASVDLGEYDSGIELACHLVILSANLYDQPVL